MASWIFVTNRKSYPGIDSDWKSQRRSMPWIVKQYKLPLDSAIGDEVYLYSAGNGIIARGLITGVAYSNLDLSGWTAEAQKVLKANRGLKQVPIDSIDWLMGNQAIPMQLLKEQVLDSDSVFLARNGNGSNFPLSATECTTLTQLWLTRKSITP